MSGKKKTMPKPPMPFKSPKKQKISHTKQKPKLTKSPSVITRIPSTSTTTKPNTRPVSPRALRSRSRAAQRQQQMVSQLLASGAVTHIPKKRQHKPPSSAGKSAGKSKPRPQHKPPSSAGKSKPTQTPSKPIPKPKTKPKHKTKPTPKPKTKPTPKPRKKPKNPGKIEPDDSAYGSSDDSDLFDSEDDMIVDNKRNTNDKNAPPPPPPIHQTTQQTQDATHTQQQTNAPNSIHTQQQIPQQNMIDIISQSQSYPTTFFTNAARKQVSFSPTKRVNPSFSFSNQLPYFDSTTQHKSDPLDDSMFLFNFNNEDAPTHPTNTVQPIADQPLFQHNHDPSPIQQNAQQLQNPQFTTFLSQQTAILSRIADLVVNKSSSSYQQKQPVDLLGFNIKNCLQSRGDYEGYPLQRLTITSNKAHAGNKNVAPSQKKLVAFTSAFEVLNVLQTFQAIKCDYTNSLVKKLEEEKIDVITRLNNGTLLPMHIKNFTNDSINLTKLLSSELLDFEQSTSLISDVFAFTKLKEVAWIWEAAFIKLMRSNGRAKLSSCLLSAGLLDAIPQGAVFDKINNNSTVSSRGNKKTCWFVIKFGSCNNKSPQHRQQFSHTKPKPRPQNRQQQNQPNQQQNQQNDAPQPPNAAN